MNLASNDNKNVISHLAKSSVKSNKLRNFFAVFAIVLSVSLLAVILLFVSGHETKEIRQADQMQNVIYEVIEPAQAEKMAEEEDVSFLMLMKQGAGIELGSKIIQPSYYGREPLKGNPGDVKTTDVKKGGHFPEAVNEVAVAKEYCDLMGVEDKIGNTLSITGIDGTTEVFTITGILDGSWKDSGVYPAVFSEDYAENGAMLKDTPYMALVKLKNAQDMYQDDFVKRITELGSTYGVERKYVNQNNLFTSLLKGDSLRRQEQITTGVICVGILFVSVLVIYSVFYLSVIGKIRQFGQLRTLGMTKKQIRKMVTREGLMLGGIGIPIGLLIGGIIGWAVQKEGWAWRNSLVIAVLVTAADLITVWISIYKPAMIAAGISPIEAAKFAGELGDGKKKKKKEKMKKKSKKLQRSMTPLGLAKISSGRSHKKTFLTVLSLAVGGILFMLAATFTVSVNLEEYSRQAEFGWGEFVINLSSNAAETNEHGLSGLQKNNPLNEELKNQLLAIQGVEKVHEFTRMKMEWEGNGGASEDGLHLFDKKEYQKIQDKYVNRDSGLKDIAYEDLVKNQQILIAGNNVVKEIFGWEFKPGDKVTMTFDNADQTLEKEYTVAGIIDDNDYNEESPVIEWFCMPRELVGEVSGGLNLNYTYIVKTDGTRQQEIQNEITDIIGENPQLILYNFQEHKEQYTASFNLLYTMILGLSIFIIGFSILNLINTLITNVVTRRQEFAMLESVGMSRRQLNRMVCMEGLLLSAGNAVITLIFGILAGYGGVELLRSLSAKYMHYHFPLWFYLGYVAVLIIVPLVVTWSVLKRFEKLALTERLKIED